MTSIFSCSTHVHATGTEAIRPSRCRPSRDALQHLARVQWSGPGARAPLHSLIAPLRTLDTRGVRGVTTTRAPALENARIRAKRDPTTLHTPERTTAVPCTRWRMAHLGRTTTTRRPRGVRTRNGGRRGVASRRVGRSGSICECVSETHESFLSDGLPAASVVHHYTKLHVHEHVHICRRLCLSRALHLDEFVDVFGAFGG